MHCSILHIVKLYRNKLKIILNWIGSVHCTIREFNILNFNHSPLNATESSVSVLQITAERTESLVEGVSVQCTKQLDNILH